jgi:hypothetical protein
MPNYGEILAFLATNPPQQEAERELHASLLELVAECLRTQQVATDDHDEADLGPCEIRWVSVN